MRGGSWGLVRRVGRGLLAALVGLALTLVAGVNQAWAVNHSYVLGSSVSGYAVVSIADTTVPVGYDLNISYPADATANNVWLSITCANGTKPFADGWFVATTGAGTTNFGRPDTDCSGTYPRTVKVGRSTTTSGGSPTAGWGISVTVFNAAGYTVAPASTCAAGTGFSSSVASYVGGVLAVRTKWSGSLPAGGWKVFPASASDSVASSSTSYGTIPPTDISPTTYPGIKGVDVTTSAVSAFLRLESTGNTGCYVNIPVGVSAVTLAPPDLGSDDAGDDCGWNPFCYFKAALKACFVPSTSVADEFSDALTEWSAHFPVNLMVSGGEAVGSLVSIYGSDMSGPGGSGVYAGDLPDTTVGGITLPGFSVFGDLGDEDNGLHPLIAGVHGVLTFLLIIGVTFVIWNRVSRSFGGKGDA